MISIAMTSYNGEMYIREQIESIQRQSLNDWELIVCDDSSTDSTWKILKDFSETDTRIKPIKNETNLGFRKNFEKAISLCSGEYIALSDQDDIWLPNHLEILMDNLNCFSLSVGNAEMVDSNNNDLGKKLNEVDGLFVLPPKDKILFRVLIGGNCFQGASSLARADFFKKYTPIPNGIFYHDAWFAACASLENGISYTFEPITRYRQHGNNITAEGHKIKKNRWNKYKIFFKYLFGSKKQETDSFTYFRELKNLFGTENKDFYRLYQIVRDIKNKRLSFSDIKFIWINFPFIASRDGHKLFFKRLISWLMWAEPDKKTIKD